jgi:hypothetical protein
VLWWAVHILRLSVRLCQVCVCVNAEWVSDEAEYVLGESWIGFRHVKWTRAIRPVDLQNDVDAQLLVVHKCGACAAQCLSDCQSCVLTGKLFL